MYCHVTIWSWARKHKRKHTFCLWSTPSQEQRESTALGGAWAFADRCILEHRTCTHFENKRAHLIQIYNICCSQVTNNPRITRPVLYWLCFTWVYRCTLLDYILLHISLPLINSFNKTDAGVFPCRLYFQRVFPFISF